MSGSVANHPSLDDPNAWVPYRYHPNLAAAVLFAVLFGIVTIIHGVYIGIHRAWYFTPFIIGGIFEMTGYIGRAASTSDIWALGPYIIQSIFLLVAPALFAASIYIILGRIIRSVHGEQYSVVPLKWLTKIFVAGDVLAFLLQVGGGGIQAGGTLQLLKLGETIIIVGLFAQVIFFGLFITVATIFHRRFTRYGPAQTQKTTWRQQMHALYGGSGLIMIRSIFRIVEYLMGNDGYLLRHEYFLYIFDATLMFLEMVLFLWTHPSKVGPLVASGGRESNAEMQELRNSRNSARRITSLRWQAG